MNADLTFYAVVVQLCPMGEGWLPATQGRLAHGAFLDLIRAVDPELSAGLHTPQQRRPFTLSPLLGTGRARNGEVRIRAGEPVWLRFTLLNSTLFETFTGYLLAPSPGRRGLPTLRLDKLQFGITEMVTTPGSHPWAGYTTAQSLCQKWHGTALGPAHSKIGLELASGTVFSRSSNKGGMGKFMEVLPTPEMVFGSLASAWNEHTGLALDKQAIREYARETVVVSAYKLETQLFHYWGNPQIGAVGRVTYQLKDSQQQELIRALNLLADFAFYSGIGAKTAMGMGMGRRRGE